MRLFCFHHAGSGGLAFNSWNKALKPSVEVIPVEVANRERFAMLRQLVDVVNAQLDPPSINRICSSATVSAPC